MDVTLPDGTVVKGIPDGMSKAELVAKLSANGHDTSWYKPEPAAAPAALPKSIGQQVLEGSNPLTVFRGVSEAGTQMGSGMLAQAIGGLRGLGTLVTGGGLDKAVEKIRGTEEAMTYQPRSDYGKSLSNAVAYLPEKANEALGAAGEAVGGAGGRTIGESILPVATTVVGGRGTMRSARAAAERVPENMIPAPLSEGTPGKFYAPQDVAAARDMAEKLRAHDLARKNNIVTVPSETNPTMTNRMAMDAADVGEVEVKLSRQNEGRWGKMLASDPDIDIRGSVSPEALKAVRDRAGKSSEAIARTGTVLPSEGHMGQMEGLRAKPTVGGKAAANEVNTRVNEAIDLVKNGADASELLRNISQLRKDARTTFKRNDAGVDAIAGAEANLKLANIFEDMIDTKLQGMHERNPYGGFDELSAQYKNDRRTMAKSYTLDDALDHNTNKVDPNVIARITASDNALTGKFADVGKIAGNFPNISKMNSPTPSTGMGGMHFSRFGPTGIVGSGLGAIVGGYPGAVAGGTMASALGEIVGRVLRDNSGGARIQSRGINPVPQSLWDLSGESPLGSAPKANPLGYDHPTPETSRAASNNRQIPLTRAALEAAIKKLRED